MKDNNYVYITHTHTQTDKNTYKIFKVKNNMSSLTNINELADNNNNNNNEDGNNNNNNDNNTSQKIDFSNIKSVNTVNSRARKGRKSLYVNNLFLKPIHKDIRGDKEIAFYEEFWSSESKHSNPGSLALDFILKYYGVEFNQDEEKFIKMTNIETDYRKPCVIDLKIGTQTYDEDASDEKKAKQIKKFKYQEQLGYRLTGMKIYDIEQKAYRKFDNQYGRHLTNLNAGQGLMNFFFDGQLVRLDAVQSIKSKLENVLKWFEEQTDFRFYAHSLLFVYEGDSNNNNTTDVKLIDFAHWYKSKPEDGRKDNGSIKGINNILKVLNAIENFCLTVQAT